MKGWADCKACSGTGKVEANYGPDRHCEYCGVAFTPVVYKNGASPRICEECRAIMKERRLRPGGYPGGLTQTERDEYAASNPAAKG